MRRLIEHGGEAEKLARCRLVDHTLLLIFIYDGYAHAAGNQDVGSPARIAHLVNALSERQSSDFHLPRQDGSFVVVQQSK